MLGSRWFATIICLALLGPPVGAQQGIGPEGPMIDKGVAWLKKQAAGANTGEAVLAGLALLKCEVKPNDPAVVAVAQKVRSRFQAGAYAPENDGGSGIYEIGIAAMFLANLDPVAHQQELQILAKTLVDRQNPNGSWDYRNRTPGDTSISQYAVLGLWEAANAGIDFDPSIWDRIALWFLSSQAEGGSWNYHRDESNRPETVAMTAAGTGSILICQMQLQRYLKAFELPSPLMTPLFPEGQVRFEPKVTARALEASYKRGLTWLSRNLTSPNLQTDGQSAFYALYGIERVGALGGRDQMGGDWYRQGVGYIQSTQQPDGSWNTVHGPVPNTSWALMFLTRATAQTVQKIEIKRLAAGTLLGGRGLPSDLSTLTVAGGRVMVRPMNGAIDSMLAALEDPRSEQTEAALSGLVEQYNARGPAVLRPLKDRFRKLISDRDPTNRLAGAWGLGRIGDFDAVPLLIKALQDADAGVVNEARVGLQVLSRKIDGFGPEPNATPEQRAEAARKWRAWFDASRPPGFNPDDGDPLMKKR